MYRYDTYCGLFCGACLAMWANEHDALEEVAVHFHTEPEKLICHGCKTDVNLTYCANCEMKKCCREKGYESCAECPDMPCEHLQKFSAEHPHRHRVIAQLQHIREVGMETFLQEQEQRWNCPQCGARFSWYSEQCPACGAEVLNVLKEAEKMQE